MKDIYRVSTTIGAVFFGVAAFTVVCAGVNLVSGIAAGVISLFGAAVCIAGRISEF